MRTSESQILDQVAAEYEAKGYRVVLHPIGDDVPHFLSGYEPDAIAYGADESVVIEVKARTSRAISPDLSQIARVVSDQPGWRLELRAIEIDSGKTAREKLLDATEITERIKSADLLMRRGDTGAALIVSWTALESLLERLAKDHHVELENATTPRLSKALMIEGLVSRQQHNLVDTMWATRNLVAHGRKVPAHSQRRQKALLSLISQLAKSVASSSAHHVARRGR